MLPRAVEDYLKTIYDLQSTHGRALTTVLAEHLEVAPASVTGMIKRLTGMGLVVHEPYQGVVLTEDGRKLALKVIRRHRLVECFLVESLGMSWDQVHDEAETLEHAISKELEARVDAFLGHPATDPHGAPIPTREGSILEPDRRRLTDLRPGETARVIEVSDHDPVLLRYLATLPLYPGTRVCVVATTRVGDTLTVDADGTRHVLGPEVTNHVFVADAKTVEPA